MHWQDSNAHFDVVDTVERTERQKQDVIRIFAFEGCSGACGGKACPAPQACERPESDAEASPGVMLVGGVIALSILLALAAIVQWGVPL